MAFRVRAFGRSHVGQVRGRNEDMMAVEPSRGIMIVADGMGGPPGGDLASALAVQEVARGLHAGLDMVECVLRANQTVLKLAESQPALKGMGTTLTALQVFTDSGAFILGHVGDSRAFHFSRDEFRQISEDHSVVRDMVAAGKISQDAVKSHPYRHLLSRSVGTSSELEVDTQEGVIEDGDRFFLCSDGIDRVFDQAELEERVRGIGIRSLEDTVEAIVEEANARGAPDNVTVAVLVVDAYLKRRSRAG